MPAWDGRAPKVGERAPDLQLFDEAGKRVLLSGLARSRPLVLLIFGGPQDARGLQLLRDYRDETLAFWRAGAALCAVGPADPAEMRYLRDERGFGFRLLADPSGAALARWGVQASSVFLLDGDFVVRQRAPADRAAPDTILSIIWRGGAKRTRPKARERLAQFAQSLQHAFRALRPAR
jgi:peroxiredoxin